MRNSFLLSSGSKKTIINNNIIEDLAYKAQYDGNEGEMIFRNNDDAYYIKVDNDDLQDILGQHSDNKSIETKLKSLLKPKKRTNKKTLGIISKTKTTRKKSPSKTRKKSPSKTRKKSPSKTKTTRKKSPSKTKTTRKKSPSKTKKKTPTILEDLF